MILDREIRRYLLGQLSEAERDEVEARLFSDEPALEQIELAEDLLIEDYVRGVLDGEERDSFERFFLSTSRRHTHLALTRALRVNFMSEVQVPEGRQPRRPFLISPQGGSIWLRAAAAAVVLTAGAAGYFGLQLVRDRQAFATRERILTEQLVAQNLQVDRLTNDLQRERVANGRSGGASTPSEEGEQNSKRAPLLPSYFLSPGTTRGAGDNTLKIPRTARGAHFRLEIEDPKGFETYEVVISTTDGREVWRQAGLIAVKTRTRFVDLVLPSGGLPPGDYKVQLTGAGKTGDREALRPYLFRVGG